MATVALLLLPAVPLALTVDVPPAAAVDLVLAREPLRTEPVPTVSRPADGPAGRLPSNWSDLNTTNPAARIFEGMTYDTADGYLLMFGGYGQGGLALNDTWIYRDQSWTELCSGTNVRPSCAVSPAAGAASMAYDPAEGYVLAVDNSGQSWAFQAGAWRALNASGRPAECPSGAPPCGSTADPIVYDPATGQVIELARDRTTWEFSGGNWTKIGVTNNPACDSDAVMFYDSTYRTTVVFCSDSGDGYVLNGLNWTTLAPSTRPSGELAAGDFDPNLGGLVTTWTGGPAYNATYTWTFQGGNWTNVSATLSHEPPAEGWGLMAFDPAYGYSVLLDGQRPGTTTNLNFTWALIDAFTAIVTATPDVLEVGQNLTLNLSLVGGIPPFNDTISGVPVGCPIPALGMAETCAPTRPGNYSLELSGTDPGINATANASVSITVFPQLAATASAVPRNTTAGYPVVYTGSVSGGDPPYEVAWSFGDGLNSTAENCSHTFAVPGVYASNFTVRDALGERILVETSITVNFPLVLTAFANVSATDVGLSVAFTARPVGGTMPYGYAWKFGDGASASTAVATHAFESPGRFPVGVTVSDAVGVIENRSLNVTISPVPKANLTVNDSAPTVGLSVTFVGAVAGGTDPFQFMWSFGDGPPLWINSSSPSVPVPHAFAAAGTFGVRLTVTDAVGVSRETSLLVNVGASGPGGSYGSHPPQGGASPVVNSTDILALASGVGAVVVALVGYLHHRRRGRRGGV